MSAGLTHDVSPGERRLMAQQKFALNPKDSLAWLELQLANAASDRDEAWSAGDNVLANKHYETTQRFGDAAKELETLRKRVEMMQTVLMNRIEIALVQAKDPSWVPTHRHYKGTLYRVTGTKRRSAEGEEAVDGVEYDDAEGNQWWLPTHRWLSTTGTGKPRYEALLPDDPDLDLYTKGPSA